MEGGHVESDQIHVEMFSNYGNEEVFRHKLGLIPEEAEGLTEAFKAKLGLNKPEEIGECDDDDDCEFNKEIGEVEWANECETNRDNPSAFRFESFMEQNFNNGAITEPTKPLTSPLLKSLSEGASNVIALNSVVISHAIKTFCKDVQSTKNNNKKASSILTTVYQNLLTKEPQDPNKKKPMISIFKGRDASPNKLQTLLATLPSEELNLMQFIVCYGILNAKLRNEIYSQLCVQVLKAKSSEGRMLAWVLHFLCAGCFLPTKRMIKYYISFLNNATEEMDSNYAKHIKKLLQRTNSFGPRYHPPNTLEFKAAKMLKKIMLPVLLADGRSITVQTDSATTASEICFEICSEVKLKDQFGFAIYISITEKVSSLGNGLDHVMDAIGECEQVSLSCRWSLFFGKEIFTPWHDAEFDEVSTNLIYCQIIRSVLNGECKFKSDEDLSRFISRRCYVELGHAISETSIRNKLNEFIPKYMKTDRFDEGKWCRLITDSFIKMDFNSNKYPREHVKWSIVEGAQMKWPLQFAALFEVHKTSANPPLSNNDVVMAISCRGIFLVEEPFKLLCGLHYYEIIEVTCEKVAKGKPSQIIIMTTSGNRWVFSCANSEIVTKMLGSFIAGLRRRSRWAVAIHDFILRDHTKDSKDDFRLRQGDIVELLDESCQSLPDDWMYGRCERTNYINRFPFDCVYIFPTTKKPPNEFLSIFAAMSQKDVGTLPRKRAAIVLKKDTITSRNRQSFI